jgi:putative CocE/NonD family hydrolase
MTVTSRFLGRMMKLPAAESHAIKVERDLRIPMPDGAVLLADRYIPAGGDGPLVLVRSPYGRANMFGTLFGTLFAERGLQVLLQSCRGTFGSGGDFDAFAETGDGLATVAWLREQDWYPGSFATAGPSYLGIVQWAIAAQAGPELKAMAALITSTEPHDLIFDGGSFSLETTLVWVNLVDRQERRLAFLTQGLSSRKLKPLYGRLPLADLDALSTGHQVNDWQGWLAHPDGDDPYWASRRFSARRAEVGAEVSFVGGWQDIFLPAELADYQALRAAGHEPYLLIGPWQHTDQQGMAAGIKESIAWCRAQLLGDKSQLRTAPVRIYIGGLEQWRDLPSWPPPATTQRWHLQPGAGLALELPPAAAEPDAYTYDPADPTPSVGGPVLSAGPERRKPPADNRELESRDDVLTYTSSPLQADLEVIGQVTAELHVRSSLEHTDFFARLCDVDPSGRSTAVCDALVRLEPGKPAAEQDGTIRARIDLWPTAYRFKSGHRVRLQVSSGAHPRYARNPGSGEPIATAAKLVPADQQVYHDAGHPSALILPVTA